MMSNACTVVYSFMAREDDQFVPTSELVTAADGLQVVIRVMVGLQIGLGQPACKAAQMRGYALVEIRACKANG